MRNKVKQPRFHHLDVVVGKLNQRFGGVGAAVGTNPVIVFIQEKVSRANQVVKLVLSTQFILLPVAMFRDILAFHAFYDP